jgi:hypothetical protein
MQFPIFRVHELEFRRFDSGVITSYLVDLFRVDSIVALIIAYISSVDILVLTGAFSER